MTPFAKRIKEYRKAKNMTQRQIADFLGTTERNYQYYESGEREPALETFLIIADMLDVSTDYLLGRSDDPTRH